MANLQNIVFHRNRSLMQRFGTDTAPPLIGTNDLEEKTRLFSYGGGALEPLPGFEGAVIWRKVTNDLTSLWVPTKKNFRRYNPAFFAFIQHLYGADVDMTGRSLFHVDHIFNNARAPDDFLIRVEAVFKGVNTSHGAGIEKRNNKSAIELSNKADGRDHRKMTFMTILKLANIKAPRSMQDHDRIAQAITALGPYGFDAQTVRQSFETAFEKADFR